MTSTNLTKQSKGQRNFFIVFSTLCFLSLSTPALAEDEENFGEDQPVVEEAQTKPAPKRNQKRSKSKYHVEDTNRVDAGVFHVAFAAGGNFWVEPKYDRVTNVPNGDYFKDFGFQGGAYFDYDYSEMTANIPLSMRGIVNYKYILNSTHVFAFDGLTRIMWRVSDNASFGLGLGVSMGMWYRAQTTTSIEETKFLPCGIVGAGFEFNPFMVDLKWLINRFGSDTTITGFELNFGFRL